MFCSVPWFCRSSCAPTKSCAATESGVKGASSLTERGAPRGGESSWLEGPSASAKPSWISSMALSSARLFCRACWVISNCLSSCLSLCRRDSSLCRISSKESPIDCSLACKLLDLPSVRCHDDSGKAGLLEYVMREASRGARHKGHVFLLVL